MKRQYIWIVALALILGGVGVFWFARNMPSGNQPYEGTELDGIAPDFRLTDQNGSYVSLSDFHGKVVVLTFMDSKCKDTCPLTAAQFLEAYKQLNQSEAKQVVFLGVNVNVMANTVTIVLETTHEWHLAGIPSWHFLTGDAKALEPVWKDYAIAVQPLPDGSEIMHTPGVFIIDSSGQERWYISTTFSEETDTDSTLPLNELLVKHIREALRDRE